MATDIFVDSSGSTNFNKVDEILYILKDELVDEDINVCFVSYNMNVYKKLFELDIPLDKNNILDLGGGGSGNYESLFKDSMSRGVQRIVLIGDMFEESMKRETIENSTQTEFYFIWIPASYSSSDATLLGDYTKNIKDLPYVFTATLDSFTSLEGLKSQHNDTQKLQTLGALRQFFHSLGKTNNADEISVISHKMNDLLKDYPSDEIEQFAQCIAGKRVTLPNSEAVIQTKKVKP